MEFIFDLQRFDSAFGGGSGTESDPYKISAVEHLQQLESDVSDGNTYEGKYFKVTVDIDLNNINWEPIGYANGFAKRSFSGTFDGDGHTISNLTIKQEYTFKALFGYVEGGTIQNLKLDNFNVKGTLHVGALVGFNDGGTIKNITATNINISDSGDGTDENLGGLVGTNQSGTVTDCTVSGTINTKGITVGGVVGSNYSTVSNCTFNGTIEGRRTVGGLVGENYGTVSGVTVSGTVTGTSDGYSMGNNIGGLVGFSGGGTITGTVSDGSSVTGINRVGGFVGYSNGGTVKNCTFNNGTVTGTIEYLAPISTGAFVGGAVGLSQGGTVESCNVSNLTINGSTSIGGLVGYSGGTVNGNTATNITVTGDERDYYYNVGGLVGENQGTVTGNTASVSSVSGSHLIGGLVGKNDFGTVTGNTSVVNSVRGKGVIGGLVGQNSGKVNGNAAVIGTVSGRGTFGELVGENKNNSTVGTADAPNYYYQSGDSITLIAINNNRGVTPVNTQVYKITLPSGVTATGGTAVTVDGTNYAAGTVTLSATASNAVIKSTNYTNNDDGTVSVTLNADANLSNAVNFYYAVNIPNCVQSVNGTSYGGNYPNYYQNGTTLNLTAKTGYKLNNTSLTVSSDTPSITATLADGVYVFQSGDNYIRATSSNVATNNYPDLTQAYQLTLPEGVNIPTNSGVLTAGDNCYVVPNSTVTLAIGKGAALVGVEGIDNVAADSKGNVTFTATGDVSIVADNIYYTVSGVDGLTVDGTGTIIDGTTYAAGSVTLTAADGYTIQNVSVNGETLDGDTFTVSAATTVLADCIKFNNTDISAATGATVGGTTGNLSAFNSVYSITAARENSTLVGNAKNNTIIISGGGRNILTGGLGNDTHKFESGSGIVTDFGIGAVESGNGKILPAPLGTDVVKLNGTVTGIYFDRAASNKKDATFMAIVAYDSDDGTHLIALQNIAKRPVKTGKNPVYQTNDVAAATMKIWDTSSGKQAVLPASKLKQLFRDVGELGNVGDTDLSPDEDDTSSDALYTFSPPENVTAEYTGSDDNEVIINGTAYYTDGATFDISVDTTQYHKLNGDSNYTVTIDGGADIGVDGYPKIGNLRFNSATDEYLIGTASQLQQLATYVNAGHDCYGLTFKLAGNIDMSGVENFAPIAGGTNQFGGTFDGNNKTISNLKISGGDNVGLFGNLDSDGTVKNLTLENVTVSGSQNVGGVVGENFGTVNGCNVNGTVSGSSGVGGVVGANSGTVSNSAAVVNGAVVGSNSGTVSNNFSYGGDANLYELALDGVTVDSAKFTVGNKSYVAAGEVAFTADDVGGTVNVAEDMTLNADNHYVRVSGGGKPTIFGGAGATIVTGGDALVELDADSNRDGAVINVSGGRTTITGSNNTIGGFTGDTIAVDDLDLSEMKFTFGGESLTIKGANFHTIVEGVSTTGADYMTQYLQNATDGTIYKAAIGAEGSTMYVAADEDVRANAYLGKDSAVDFTGYSGDAVVDLGGDLYDSSIDGNAAYFNGVNQLVGGTGKTFFIGSDAKETLIAGAGNTSIYGGGGTNILSGYGGRDKEGSTTFMVLGVNDGAVNTISGFEFVGEHNYIDAPLVTADQIETDIENNHFSNVAIVGDDLLIEVTGNSTGVSEKALLVGGAGKNFAVNGIVAQVGSTAVNVDDKAEYYLATGANATVNVDGSVDGKLSIWLGDDGRDMQFEGDFTVIDARNSTGKAELAGNDADNVIYAGNGATSLWGGNGGNDLMYGGAAADEFYYAAGNGSDTINAGSGDSVYFVNLTLDDITIDTITSSAVAFSFKDGGKLTVNDNNSGVTFTVGNETYRLNNRREFE
ncbi:MAG: hypothetical protein SR1Q7_00210 [Quinella sp. 1Q7]|nr:hypothetical protein [Quinella sp. 1Q7]